MKCATITSKFLAARIALIFATLLSLCVSNNVGPSFLPLPVITDLVTENRPDKEQNTASRVPSSLSESLRIPMVAQSQNRAGKHQHAQPLSATPKPNVVLPDETRVVAESSYLISPVTSPSILQPPGRAPPLLPL